MARCARLREVAPGLASLPLDDPERVAARSHARGCPGCARSYREALQLQVLITSTSPEELPAGALERASRAILTDLRREAAWRSLAAAAAALVAFAAFVGLARPASRPPGDWVLAAVLGLVAPGLAASASRRPFLAAAGAVGAALAAALTAERGGALLAHEGVRCVATELAAAAAVVWAGWVVLRGGSTSWSRAALAASAAAGALAGGAALQISCGAHESAPHLLVFHVGGVLLAAAAVALGRPVLRAAG